MRGVTWIALLCAMLAAGCGATPPVPSTSAVPPTLTPTATTSPPPASSAPATPSPSGDTAAEFVLPTPTTTDVAVLVGDPAALNPRETQWLADLRAEFGRVDALGYGSATLDALTEYFTIFVIDQNPQLRVDALAQAYAAGLTVHLVGPAADYRAQVVGTP